MANRDILVVVPATTQDLLTLDEAKTLLGMSTADTSRDAQLQMQISIASATIAEMANRCFGEQTVIETWRDFNGEGRLFLSQWPIVDPTGITEVTEDGVERIADIDYDLEGQSGKLDLLRQWNEPAIVHYTGGYKLPDEAPLPLKYAALVLVRQEKIYNQQAQVAGMRQLRHKEAQVSFYDPNALAIKAMGAAGQTPGQQQAMALIQQYMRIEV